jgi:hypothetical protein
MCKFGIIYDFLVKILARAFHNEIAQALSDNGIWVKNNVLSSLYSSSIGGFACLNYGQN